MISLHGVKPRYPLTASEILIIRAIVGVDERYYLAHRTVSGRRVLVYEDTRNAPGEWSTIGDHNYWTTSVHRRVSEELGLAHYRGELP